MSIISTLVDAFSPGGVRGQKHQRFEEGLQQQEETRAQQEATWKTVQHAMELGALPVVGGMVKRTMYNAGNPDLGVGPTNGTLLDKADPTRTVKWGTGQDEVSLELPTEEDQRNKHIYQQFADATNPARRQSLRIQNQEGQDAESGLASAKTRGTAAGVTQGKQADLEARGVPLSDELADAVGIARGTLVTPEERDTLTEKYNPVRATQTRMDAAANRQQASLAARASGVKSTHVTVGPDGKQSLLTVFNNGETEEAPMEATAAPKTTGSGGLTPGQAGVQNRFNQKLQEMASKKHDDLQAKEQKAWDLKGAIGDVLTKEDGDTFVDPTIKNGKEIAMNSAQRVIFQNRYKAAEKNALQLQSDAKKIRQKYGWGEFGQDASSQGSASQSATQAPAAGIGSGTPGSAAPRTAAPRPATRAQVQSYAKKFRMTEQQAMKAFADQGYEVR